MFIVLAVIVHSVEGPLDGELRVSQFLGDHTFWSSGFSNRVVDLGGPTPLAFGIATLVVTALLLRDRFGAIIAVIGPATAIGLSEGVGKPLVARHEGQVFGFPSSHSTSVTALSCVAALLIYRRWGRKILAIISPALALLPFAMTVALIRLHDHLPSDAIAGVLLAAGTVFGLAGLLSVDCSRRTTERS